MTHQNRIPFTPKDNPYRDIFYIPNARHERPFRVTTDGSCFQTLQEAMEHRDHYELNREAIEAERKAKRQERKARKERMSAERQAWRLEVCPYFEDGEVHYV